MAANWHSRLGEERPQPPVTLPPAPWIEKAPLDESEIKQTAARFDRRFQAFLDSGVFTGPERGKQRKCRGVHLVVTDASEPVAAPAKRKVVPVAHWWWVHAGV